MKKVLFFIQTPPPIHGVSVINQFIYNNEYITNNISKSLLRINFANSISELNNFSISKVNALFFLWFKLLKVVLIDRPDYCYFTIVPTGSGFFRDAFFSVFLKLSRLKIIYHLHGKGIYEIVSRNRILKLFYKFVFNNSLIIHLSNNLLAKDILSLDLKRSHYFIVENYVSENMFNVVPLSVKDERLVNITFLSNLSKSKGYYVLAEAIKLLSKKYNNLRFNLIGDCADKKIMIHLSELASQSHQVIYHGKIIGKRKIELLLQSDIFVHPTLNDAFPLVILEAMACKLPVVSTFQGAIPEIIEDGVTGILIKENSVEDLIKAIEILVSDKALRITLGENGFVKCRKNYTQATFERKMATIFSGL